MFYVLFAVWFVVCVIRVIRSPGVIKSALCLMFSSLILGALLFAIKVPQVVIITIILAGVSLSLTRLVITLVHRTHTV